MENKTYLVTSTLAYPAWDDKPISFEVKAANKSEAIKRAKRESWKVVEYLPSDGRVIWVAKAVA